MLQPREFSEMVVRSIPEWFASAMAGTVGAVAAAGGRSGSFLADFACFARVIFQI